MCDHTRPAKAQRTLHEPSTAVAPGIAPDLTGTDISAVNASLFSGQL
ncbi:hypothetical protein [Streptomyces sp. NPDC097610]